MKDSNSNEEDIRKLLKSYFDGLYYGDIATLAEVFHPKAQYICACGDNTLILDMPTYFKKVEQRPRPASMNEQRQDRILSIDIAGPETAFAKLNCAIADRYFTDFLSLIKEDKRWKIISKVFHYDILKSPR